MRFVPAFWLSAFLAAAAGFAPILAIPLLGFDVPTASQVEHDSPAPALRQGDTWSQTFYFPDRPVTGVALRPGTYGGGHSGYVTGRIEPLFFAGRTAAPAASMREFTIPVNNLRDNHWHSFHFAPLPPMDAAAGILRLTGTALPEENAFTLWRNTRDTFSDGVFTINGDRQLGDLCFSILCRIRGLDAARMVKSRWQENRTGRSINILWVLLPALTMPAILLIGLLTLLRQPGKPAP